ncbi:MAG: glycosyltransferase family 2 protein [Pseudomonadota bacterium]
MKIFIITVCFNSAKYISDALRSVNAQTWPDIEHIIVDGTSRDDTLRVVEVHPIPWRRVISEQDKGFYDAMNKGIRLCQEEIIGFINSDDFYSSPDVLAKIAAVFTDPLVDACYGNLCHVKKNDTQTIIRYSQSSKFTPRLFLQGWCPPHPTLFLRREVYE